MTTETPDSLFGVSKTDWFMYESLRRSGIMNMWGAGTALGLTNEEDSAIRKHYSEMRDAWLQEFDDRGLENVLKFQKEEED